MYPGQGHRYSHPQQNMQQQPPAHQQVPPGAYGQPAYGGQPQPGMNMGMNPHVPPPANMGMPSPHMQNYQQPTAQGYPQQPPAAGYPHQLGQAPAAVGYQQPPPAAGYGQPMQHAPAYGVGTAPFDAATALAQQQAQVQANILQQQTHLQSQAAGAQQQQNEFMQQQLAAQQKQLRDAEQKLQDQQNSARDAQRQLEAAKERERVQEAAKAQEAAYNTGFSIAQSAAAEKAANEERARKAKGATILDHPTFDAVQDANLLRKAMKGFGSNKKTIADIVGKRSNAQRQAIVSAYKEHIKRDLIDDLKSETGGNFQSLVKSLMRTPASFDASVLRKAMKGVGCDEEVLIEVLCTRSPAHLEKVKEEYEREYKRNLVNDVHDETKKFIGKSDLKRILMAILTNPRDADEAAPDMSKAQLDAQTLVNAGEKKWGTDQKKFIEIFTSRSFAHLKLVFLEYQKICSYDIRQSIKREMGSSHLAQALKAIVGYVRDLDVYFAKRLRDSMKGVGTKDKALIRVVVSRSEVDLAHIKDRFARDSQMGKGQTLAKWIQDDTNGDFERLLLHIVNGNKN